MKHLLDVNLTHLGDAQAKQRPIGCEGIYPDSAFQYRAQDNTYVCPAGHLMKPRRLHWLRRTWEYTLPRKICAACPLQAQCTRATKTGRTLHQHEHQELLDKARRQSHSMAGRRAPTRCAAGRRVTHVLKHMLPMC